MVLLFLSQVAVVNQLKIQLRPGCADFKQHHIQSHQTTRRLAHQRIVKYDDYANSNYPVFSQMIQPRFKVQTQAQTNLSSL